MNLVLAVLAAWLHDIGKFAQRAGAPASRHLAHEYCPNGASHAHVLYTDYFIEHVLPLPAELEAQRGELARLASAHHKPAADSREETALRRADCLSSGLDRSKGEAGGDYKSARLESIFSQVRLDGKGLAGGTAPGRYRLAPMDEGDAIFPAEQVRDGGYGFLYAQFRNDLKILGELQGMGLRAYMSSLVSLLERYTWCVPSSTYNTRADISLYDHAATTAAITQALLRCPQGEEKLLLFGADLSGIQTFIFGSEAPADKGANKLLRARSFLLQALTRSVWLVLLDRLGLDAAAKIMDAGGRFVLLLPDTREVRQELDKLENDVEDWLYDNYLGALRLNFAHIALQGDDLRRERFAACFEEFNDALEKAKLRPFARIFRKGRPPIFSEDYDKYHQFGECGYCRCRPASHLEENGAGICRQCAQLIDIGARLPKTSFLVFSRNVAGGVSLFDGVKLVLCEQAPQAAVARAALDAASIRDDPRFAAAPMAGHIPRITPEDVERWRKEKRLGERDGESCFSGEPCKIGDAKTFAMLAEEARVAPARPDEPWRSIACLAICKADVDNLGLLFGIGFGVGENSNFAISRFAMLARMLNYFFSAWLMRVIEREFPDIYVVFAGGDDLFVLGPWDKVIWFARRMREDFRRFCGDNPAVTISAGLPLVKPGLPMRAMREAAENCLEDSKNSSDDKNAVTLFGETALWPEFDNWLDAGSWLEELCLQGKISQGLVRRMLGYARDCRDFNKGNIKKGLYLSHLAYDLARNCQDMDSEDLRRLKAMAQDKDRFPRAQMAISWALYRTRTG